MTGKETTNTSVTITAHEVIEDCYLMNERDGGRKISWDDRPLVGDILDYSYDTGYFDITKAIRDWYEHPEKNNGLLFKAYNEDSVNKLSGFSLRKSKTSPYLVVTYRTAIGNEDYYSAHTINVGTAGSGFINDYTGSLTVLNTDVATVGERAPMTISHCFNSNAVAKDKWHLNYEERISIPCGIVNVADYPYVYTDEDGTPHYFKKSEVKYLLNGTSTTVATTAVVPPAKDEDGLKLFIVPVTDAKLKDKYYVKLIDKSASTVKYFDKLGRLVKIVDSNVYEKNIAQALTEGNDATKTRVVNAVDINYENCDYNNSLYTEAYKEITDIAEKSATLKANRNKITDKVELKSKIDNLMIDYKKVMEGYYATHNYAVGLNVSRAYEALMYVTDATTIADMRVSIENADKFYVRAKDAAISLDTIANKRIANVTDGIGRVSNFSYNENNQIISISDPVTGKDNEYSYTNGNLTKINFANGTTAEYKYDKNNNLSGMVDVTGYEVDFSYSELSNKIEKVHEHTSDSDGQTYSIQYDSDNTNTFRFSGLNDVYGDEDDIENVYVFDEKGHAICTYSKFVGKDEIIGAQASAYGDSESEAKNKIKDFAVVGMTTQNLLKNHDFETANSEWIKYQDGFDKITSSVFPATGSVYMGAQAGHLVLTAAKTGTLGYKQKTNVLSPGTYTVSSYVMITALSGGKAYIKVNDENVEIARSEELTEETNKLFNKGWERLTATFTIDTSKAVEIKLEVECAGQDKYAGKVDFDSVQIETGDKANDYNILEDGNFELTSDLNALGYKWTASTDAKGTTITEGGVFGDQCLKIVGESNKKKTITQNVKLRNSKQGYVLSGWIKAECTPSRDNRLLRVTAIHKTDSVVIKTYVDINNFSSGWRYFTLILPVASWGSTNIQISCNNNLGDVYVDNLQLSINDVSTKKYDSAGRVISSCASEKTNSYTYDGYNRVSTVTIPNGAKSTYSYDGCNNIKKVSATVGPNVHFTYDIYGNSISTVTNAEPSVDENGNIVKKPGLYAFSSYDDTHSFMKSSTDNRGNVVEYEYDLQTGDLTGKKIPNAETGQTQFSYQYDDRRNLLSANQESDGNTRQVNYKYNNKKELVEIDSAGCDYGYVYDDFGNIISTTVAGKPVCTNVYNNNNGSLIRTEFADGSKYYNEYDKYGRTIANKYEKNGEVVDTDKYEYYNDGGMAKHTDVENQRKELYEYNDAGKIIRTKIADAADETKIESKMQYIYNVAGQIEELYYQEDEEAVKKYLYAYAADGTPTKNTLPDGSAIARSYDSLRRNTASTYAPVKNAVDGKKLYTKVAFEAGKLPEGQKLVPNVVATSNLVNKFTQRFGTNGRAVLEYKYSYNNRDQISSVKAIENYGKLDPKKTILNTIDETYKYNNFGELLKVVKTDNSGNTTEYEYTYDESGNIQTEEITVSDKTILHEYKYDLESEWKDKLISFDGKTITYDDAGKPLSYLGKTMTWSAKNDCLTSIENEDGSVINYSYLSDGSRYTKTVAGKTKTYFYNNGIMLSERDDLTRLNYYYDSDGAVVELGVQKRTSSADKWGKETRYFLVRNGQSDVVAIYKNSDSTLVGTYDYDAWGNVLSVEVANGVTDSDDIMNLNPIRYRGYYYDTETKFYYLNARYYDPAIHRFISADSVIAGVSQGVTGYNLFAYCDNDPINKTDTTGNWPEWNEIDIKQLAETTLDAIALVCAIAGITVATTAVMTTPPGAMMVVACALGVGEVELACGGAVAVVVEYEVVAVMLGTGSALLKSSSFGGMNNSSRGIESGNSSVPDYVSENRVPLDRETILNSSDFLKTNMKVKGAQVYKNGNYYYYRDTLHVGERAHLEVFNWRGIHIGEANPITGEIIEGTADVAKRLIIK